MGSQIDRKWMNNETLNEQIDIVRQTDGQKDRWTKIQMNRDGYTDKQTN